MRPGPPTAAPFSTNGLHERQAGSDGPERTASSTHDERKHLMATGTGRKKAGETPAPDWHYHRPS